MPGPAATLRDRIKALSPEWMREGTEERKQYGLGLAEDAIVDKMSQGGLARFPTRAQPDANRETGKDRLIVRGLTESDASYGVRLQRAFETWQHAGAARSVLSQELGYVLATTPQVTEVSAQYVADPARVQRMLGLTLGMGILDASNTSNIVITTKGPTELLSNQRVTVTGVLGNDAANVNNCFITVIDDTHFGLQSTVGSGAYTSGGRVILTSLIPATAYPPTRLRSKWITYTAGADPTGSPAVTRGVTSGNGDFDWDSLSQVNDSWIWWGTFLILQSVGLNAWIGRAARWGVVGLKWGAGATYVPPPATAGFPLTFSRIINGKRVAAGFYIGYAVGWGVNRPSSVGLSVLQIAAQFKAAHAVLRCIVISFDATLFDATQPAGGGINPDGKFGRWSKIVSGQRVASRFSNAVYAAGTL